MFKPELPEDKSKAIDLVGFGLVDKVFLEFDQEWTAKTDGLKFLYNDGGISYSPTDAANDWTRFVVGAYAVDHRPNILSLWVTGEGAKKMESLTNDQIKIDSMILLRKFVGIDFPDLPEPINIQVKILKM
jgi:spermine oxidase